MDDILAIGISPKNDRQIAFPERLEKFKRVSLTVKG